MAASNTPVDVPESGLWRTSFSVLIDRRRLICFVLIVLIGVKFLVIPFPFRFASVLWLLDEVIFNLATVIFFYIGCMTGKDEERNQPNLAKLVEFSLKFLVLSIAVRFSADWSYSASTGSLFGGSLQIKDLTQGDGSLGVVFAVTFWLLKWSWGLVLIVLFGTMLPSSFFSSKAGIRRTVTRGIAGSGFIISRMLLGPLPVMLVFTLWGGVILVTGGVLKELDASGAFHVSESLRNWSYFSLLTIVGDVLELFAFLIAGVVLVRGYRIGEERLSTAQE